MATKITIPLKTINGSEISNMIAQHSLEKGTMTSPTTPVILKWFESQTSRAEGYNPVGVFKEKTLTAVTPATPRFTRLEIPISEAEAQQGTVDGAEFQSRVNTQIELTTGAGTTESVL